MSKGKGKVAFVTGAAQGIGRGIALRLAKDGYSVAVNDLPSQQGLLDEVAKEVKQSLLGETLVVTGDVSSEEDVSRMVATCVEKLGGLHVVRYLYP